MASMFISIAKDGHLETIDITPYEVRNFYTESEMIITCIDYFLWKCENINVLGW